MSSKSNKKAGAIKEKYTKAQILSEIAENTELTRNDVKKVLDELELVIDRHIKKKSCGEFVLPGMFKIVTKKKPAQKAKKNVPNPFKPGELIDVAAKPASTQVKIRALKKLKDAAGN
ncbi:MAG: HU family DNA-binding protein [Endozoicomonadaceae bacterium]|nr:HU family DNA-binding protein [Endozoicomonadaceae bacterium]MCY4329635.1 HU family DNA-binding protein [Endozoicomonadaceae bacterium]